MDESAENTMMHAVKTVGLNLWYGTISGADRCQHQNQKRDHHFADRTLRLRKSTLLRSINRINERLGYVRVEGSIKVMDEDIYAPGVEPAQLRKQVGMVFQRPNPLPLSIRENVLFGHKIHTPLSGKMSRSEEDGIVETALRRVLLWEKVKDKMKRKATRLSLE